MLSFVGRKKELTKLNELAFLQKPNLVVIKGRRRIGKSRLVAEFAKDKLFLSFSGIAPVEHVSAQDQRNAFAVQLASLVGQLPSAYQDWSEIFAQLTHHLTDQPTVVLFDEISWMGAQDPTFVPKLKNWWDLSLQHYPHLTLIFCGSISTWIEDNVINSTAFFGRISLYITLQELSLKESYQLLTAKGFKASVYDTLKMLAVTGGVPWYLEQIMPHQTADDNIKRLCFEKDGLLVQEFDRIFYDLFVGKALIYKKIVDLLGEGMKDLAQIKQGLHRDESANISRYLKNLVISGYVDQHYTWSIKTGKITRRSLYRLNDNYLRFYIKYIEPHLSKIHKGSYAEFALSGLPGWETMMGFQIESLILKNRHVLLQKLGIPLQDVVADNPYVQRATTRHKGCQIDYLIQTQTNNLFVCEFKCRTREVGPAVIESVQDKIKRFALPRGFGVCPVLVHFSGVADAVYDKRYFYRIIDVADFLD